MTLLNADHVPLLLAGLAISVALLRCHMPDNPDPLQGPSWSGLDYGGHWKLLQYNIRHVFSPLLVSWQLSKGPLQIISIYVTSDIPHPIAGRTFSCC